MTHVSVCVENSTARPYDPPESQRLAPAASISLMAPKRGWLYEVCDGLAKSRDQVALPSISKASMFRLPVLICNGTQFN